MILKNNLKTWRKKALFNQPQLAKASNLSVQTIWEIEKNKPRKDGYTATTLIKIYTAIRKRMPHLKIKTLFPDIDIDL